MHKIDGKIPIIPGRGLVTALSNKLRLDYLSSKSISTEQVSKTDLDVKTIQKNIESYIGTVEIPLGIVGPLLFRGDAEKEELVYTAAGTLEGALVASMNRGARALSLSGGFTANVLWQRMTRAPLFMFEKEEDVPIFESFISSRFAEIKKTAESYSNHAKLLELECISFDNFVHVKFAYTTGDASGQNMTTICTWHAMLFIVDKFTRETGIRLTDYILEGNGSSDKKISNYSTTKGRGVNVTAECFLTEKVMKDVLRTSPGKMMQAFSPSRKLAKIDGMFGYNINVANAVAAIFVATGQDLACIHESSVGILNLRPTEDGLHISLNLPNLVIGTVGGGTHLTKQSEGLKILKCDGSGKINRFAKLIAGFAMSLEISTYAAVVSGEFAKAHEKLGRNRPVEWLGRSELTGSFLGNCLSHFDQSVVSVELEEDDAPEDGILTHIAKSVSKKLIGFESLKLSYKNGTGELVEKTVLLKSKALDDEVVKGLHVIAASIDPELSDLIKEYRHQLEFESCHFKEGEAYCFLQKHATTYIPQFYGEYRNEKREIFLFVIEHLDPAQLHLFNSENSPEQWTPVHIEEAIRTAQHFHRLFREKGLIADRVKFIKREFEPWKANPLYNKLVSLLVAEEKDPSRKVELENLLDASLHLERLSEKIAVQKTIVHNDYNPRNIAVRKNGALAVYDWELAVLDYPHRDIVEFLSFAFTEDYTEEELMRYLDFHYQFNRSENPSRSDWYLTYEYAIIEFIITRAVFYEVAGIVVKYEFSRRILDNALKMLRILRSNAQPPPQMNQR
jgi:hydroxymethylglutaryl-CoA reductase (NADPH)